MQVTPLTRERLAEEISRAVTARPGRLRVAVDGAPPTGPEDLAADVVRRLPVLGRPALLVRAGDFLRPASVRLEYGRTDADALLDLALDTAALRREVLDPMPGSGRVLPRLWDAAADRSFRDAYVALGDGGVVIVAGGLLLGRGLPFELTVHLQMSAAALERHTSAEQRWTLAAYARYERENDPSRADVLVRADHPQRPAMVH
ncbi:uridine kinase [Pseudonocardia sp.]|uniref:uridine kinase n=1 Tax=Pseudonocardia sp. TaxID=60912 RepID=UPI003D0BD843